MDPAAHAPQWKAPTEDRQTLIWPEPAQLVSDARQNHARLSAADSILIQNVPVPQVRRALRRALGHPDDQLLFANGHQAELSHPGVWAKNVLIDAAARKMGGRAIHFAVDTDAPRHLALRWPGGSVPLSDDPAALSRQWSGLLAPPNAAHLRHIERDFAAAARDWDFRPVAGESLELLGRLAPHSPSLPQGLAEALRELDASMGLGYQAALFSGICQSEPYLLFAHHLLARADSFGSQYNEALSGYRREHRIKSPGRPMPDLTLSAESCEVPFWLDLMSAGTRQRALVVCRGGRWALPAGPRDLFELNPAADGWEAARHLRQWLDQHDLRLAPRALTLTAVLRLLVADQFVHGIGGARYDQVLDELVRSHFGLAPPAFWVTTATLYFPQAVGQPRVCLSCVLQEGHRLKHGILGPRKMELVSQIASLPRRSEARSELFARMHEELAGAWADPAIRQWEQRLSQTEARAQEERALFDREMFYAIQTRQRLADLIEQYREQLAKA